MVLVPGKGWQLCLKRDAAPPVHRLTAVVSQQSRDAGVVTCVLRSIHAMPAGAPDIIPVTPDDFVRRLAEKDAADIERLIWQIPKEARQVHEFWSRWMLVAGWY